MLAPRPTKLRSQRDINLWGIPLQLSLAAILRQAETGAIVSCPKSGGESRFRKLRKPGTW
jgi:hypothetical protein